MIDTNTLLLMSRNRSSSFLTPNITNNPITICVPNLCLTETIELSTAEEVQVDRIRESDEKANEGYTHGEMVGLLVGEQASKRGKECASRDRSNDPGRAPFGVSSEAADSQCEDQREDT